MALGRRIKEALGDREQKVLVASIDGLTQQTLSNLITRDSKTSEFAIRIADRLGVSVRWLLDGTGRMLDPEWPFRLIDRRRWDACDDVERGFVQSRMDAALCECEARRAAGADAPQPQKGDMGVTGRVALL